MRTKAYNMRSVCGGFLGIIVSFAMAMTASADGFRNPPEGAAALGRAGTRLTQGDDPSTISHNPANLMDLEKAVVMPSLTIGYSKTKFTSSLTGVSDETKNPWRMLPSVYAAWPLEEGEYVFGIALNTPYGQATEWDKNGAFRVGAPYFAEMMTLNATPTLATKLGSSVSVGVGVNLMWSDLEFRQQLPWLPLPAGLTGPVSDLSFEGDGYGIGAKIGLTWQVTDKQRIAVAYQSPVDITYEGDFRIGNMPPPGALPPMITPVSDFETEFKFPSVVSVGYGIQATETLRLEANVEWVEHSRNDKFDLDVANNNMLLVAAAGSTTIPQNWEDQWVVDLGADWMMTPECVLRAGWTYLPTPTPESTFMSTLPENDKNIFAVGLGYTHDAHTLDLAYALNITDDRTIANNPNPAVQGKYEFEAHLIGVSYTYAF